MIFVLLIQIITIVVLFVMSVFALVFPKKIQEYIIRQSERKNPLFRYGTFILYIKSPVYRLQLRIMGAITMSVMVLFVYALVFWSK